MASRGNELDDAFENEREIHLREIFEDAVNHSYEYSRLPDGNSQLEEAYEIMLFAFFPTDEELQTERPENFQIARDHFYELLDIDREDFDWAAWRELNGY